MKKTAAVPLLLLAGALALAAADLPKAKAVQPLKPKPLYRFEVQGIKRVSTLPNQVVFQVQYYISPTFAKACFIGADVPNTAHLNRNFSYVPAGRVPAGVPKGQQHFADNVRVDVRFDGAGEYTSSSIEVKIYDADGAIRGSSVIPWGQRWSRFDIQGIKRVTTRPEFVKCQVQYFIDPAYPRPCFIGVYVPSRAHPNAAFSYRPAGVLPAGVPKGQHHFTDNVWFDISYAAAVPYTSTTMEVVIYDSASILNSKIVNWGQTWSTAVY